MTSPTRMPFERLAQRYAVEREIGRGATATVYLARDIARDESVALKVLRPELAESKAVGRFLREIRITSTLQHPRILPVLDAGESEGWLFFVLPYMNEGTLRQRLNTEKQLPIREALAITRTIAEALEHAHAQGLIHRDIKPENILFAGGAAHLADFGIARALETVLGDSSSTAGVVRGTVAYMSPEQASGAHDYDGRSDFFSLGCVLYEMIAGVPAFIGPTAEAILTQRLTHRPRDIGVYRPTVPKSVDALLQRATAISPADRFRSAAEMVAALRAVETELDAPPRLDDPRRSSEKSNRALQAIRTWLQRRPLVVATAGVVVIVAIAVAYRWIFSGAISVGKRDWVLVADFEGPAGDQKLATTMRELVTAELNQSRTLATVTRQQINSVMRLAGVAETTHVDAGLARQLAVRSAVRAIVVGAIEPIGGGRYSLALHVVSADTGQGRNLYNTATTSTEDQLVEQIGGLARNVRRRLGEERSEIAATLPLVAAATPSFRAYQTYLDGLARAQAGDVRGSNDVLRSAIGQDPQFAAAYAALGANYLGARQVDSAQAAFQTALSLKGRLTDAQKYRLQGDIAYSIDHDIPAAIRWYDLYVAELPRSIGGRNNRALHLSEAGRYEDAAVDLRATIATNPFGPSQVQISLFNLTAMLVSMGQIEDAAKNAADLSPSFAAGARLLIAGSRGQWSEVDSFSTAIESQRTNPPLLRILAGTGHAAALAARGSADTAVAWLRTARDSSRGPVSRWYDRSLLLCETAYGVPQPGAVSFADSSAAAVLNRALRAAIRADTIAAQRDLGRIAAFPVREQRLLGYGPSLVRGWIAAAAGHWQQVTDSLARTARQGEHDATALDRVSSIEIRWLVANAFAAQGKLDSAIVYMNRAVSPLRVPAGHLLLRGLVLPAAHERLAEWYNRIGDSDRARTEWKDVLDLVSVPDAHTSPLLERARAGRAVPKAK